MSILTCEYCTAEFSSRSVLNRHQKTVIKCLEMQGKIVEKFPCHLCGKELTRQDILEKHIANSCKKSDLAIEKKVTKITDVKKYATKQDRLDHIREIVENNGGELLSEEYVNNVTKIKLKCSVGHIWEVLPHRITGGHWCSSCNNGKPTIEVCKNLAKERGGECLEKLYNNASTMMKWECSIGHIWSAPWSNVYNNNSWCGKCALSVRHEIETIQEFMEAEGYTLLSDEYKNSKKKLNVKCPKNHEYQVTWHDFGRGNRCPYCQGKIVTLENVYELAKSRGYECLSDEYVNSTTKMTFKCPKGHLWETMWNSFQQGCNCAKCLYKNEEITRNIFESILGVEMKKTKSIFINKKMELDGYNSMCGLAKNIKIGFEYQGEQHYMIVKHYHKSDLDRGEKRFALQQERDQLKRDECEDLNIYLVEIPYWIKNKEKFIQKKLVSLLNKQNYENLPDPIETVQHVNENGFTITKKRYV